MPLLDNSAQETIGLYSWWQQTKDLKKFIVVDFVGFAPITEVKVVLLNSSEAVRIEAQTFLRMINQNKIKRL